MLPALGGAAGGASLFGAGSSGDTLSVQTFMQLHRLQRPSGSLASNLHLR